MNNILHPLVYELPSVTAEAAIACYNWIGRGDEKAADLAAVTAIREKLNQLKIDGTIVIGEGERDKAPMLFIGEKVGSSGLKIDIAVDPLEGTTLCAHNKPDSISVIAVAESGNLLAAPDIYMEKIAIGPNLPADLVDLDATPTQNIKELVRAMHCNISDINVAVLKRPRHNDLIQELRSIGVKITLIDDGDVLACLKTAISDDIDIYMGIGGAPEGVLAAAGLKCLGGQMQTRLIFQNNSDKKRAIAMNIKDLNKKYNINEMIKGEVALSATWVTDGFLPGVQIGENKIITNTLLLSSWNQELNIIEKIWYQQPIPQSQTLPNS